MMFLNDQQEIPEWLRGAAPPLSQGEIKEEVAIQPTVEPQQEIPEWLKGAAPPIEEPEEQQPGFFEKLLKGVSKAVPAYSPPPLKIPKEEERLQDFGETPYKEPTISAMSPEQKKWEEKYGLLYEMATMPEQKKQYIVREGGLWSKDPKVNYWSQELSYHLPFLLTGFASPAFVGMYEGLQQMQNASVSAIKGEKYKPLDSRSFSEFISEDSPEWVKWGALLGEEGIKMVLSGLAAGKISRKAFDKNVDLWGEKATEVGYDPKEVGYIKDMLKKFGRPEDLRREMERYLDIKRAGFKSPVTRQIGQPTVSPEATPTFRTALPEATRITRPVEPKFPEQAPASAMRAKPTLPIAPEPPKAPIIPPEPRVAPKEPLEAKYRAVEPKAEETTINVVPKEDGTVDINIRRPASTKPKPTPLVEKRAKPRGEQTLDDLRIAERKLEDEIEYIRKNIDSLWKEGQEMRSDSGATFPENKEQLQKMLVYEAEERLGAVRNKIKGMRVEKPEAKPAPSIPTKPSPAKLTPTPFARWVWRQGGIKYDSIAKMGIGAGEFEDIIDNLGWKMRLIRTAPGKGVSLSQLVEDAEQKGFIKEPTTDAFAQALKDEVFHRTPRPSTAQLGEYYEDEAGVEFVESLQGRERGITEEDFYEKMGRTMEEDALAERLEKLPSEPITTTMKDLPVVAEDSLNQIAGADRWIEDTNSLFVTPESKSKLQATLNETLKPGSSFTKHGQRYSYDFDVTEDGQAVHIKRKPVPKPIQQKLGLEPTEAEKKPLAPPPSPEAGKPPVPKFGEKEPGMRGLDFEETEKLEFKEEPPKEEPRPPEPKPESPSMFTPEEQKSIDEALDKATIKKETPKSRILHSFSASARQQGGALNYNQILTSNAIQEGKITSSEVVKFLEAKGIEVRNKPSEIKPKPKEPPKEEPRPPEIREKKAKWTKEPKPVKENVEKVRSEIPDTGEYRLFKRFLQEKPGLDVAKINKHGYLSLSEADPAGLQKVLDNLGKYKGDFEKWKKGKNKEYLDKYRKAVKEKPEQPKPVISSLLKEPRLTKIKKIKDKLNDKKYIESITRQEVKEIQTKVIEILEGSDLELKDRAKFIRTIKNIQTPKQFKSKLPTIKDRILKLEQAEIKRGIRGQIKKELKYTKPLKKGQKKVAKFDYERNKFLQEIRRTNRISQAAAQMKLDAMPTEGLSEFDKIKARFLSLKANGAKASLPLHEQVLADIRRMKELGRAAKEEADFIKRLEKQEKIKEALEGIKGQKPTRKFFKALKSGYVSSVANLHSTINTIAGKDIADKYDYARFLTNSEIAFNKKTGEISKQAKEIYGLKNNRQLNQKFIEELAPQEYKLTDKDGVEVEINKFELIDIYNATKNDLIKERYNNAFGEGQINALLNNLNPEDIKLADYLMEEVQKYKDILNQRSIEITGRDMEMVEDYWPSTAERQIDFYDDIRIQGETPSAIKERVKSSKIIPRPRNAWLKAQKHIAQAEHVKGVSPKYEELKNIFTDRAIRVETYNKFNQKIYGTLMDHIETLSLNYRTQELDVFSGVFNTALNNWVKAKVASPTVGARQLISCLYSVDKVGIKNYLKYSIDATKNPKKAFRYMMQNEHFRDFIKDRFKYGFSEAMEDAIRGSKKLKVGMDSITKYVTGLVRTGDVGAIIINGYPIFRTEMAKHGNKEKAFEEFQKFTEKTQQSRTRANLSTAQRNNAFFVRLFFRFKNTLNQLLRLQTDATIQFMNKQIPASEFAKKILLYAVYTPAMYVLMGYLVKEAWQGIFGAKDSDDEEEKKSLPGDIVQQIIIQPFQTLPLLDAAAENAYAEMRKRVTGKEYYYGKGLFSPPLLDDVATAWGKLKKKEPSAEDFLRVFSLIQEPITGIPTETILRYFRYARPEVETNKEIANIIFDSYSNKSRFKTITPTTLKEYWPTFYGSMSPDDRDRIKSIREKDKAKDQEFSWNSIARYLKRLAEEEK